MSLILIAIAFTVLAWFLNRWNNRVFVRLASKTPSNRLHTLLGFGKIFTGRDMLSYLFEYGKKYGPSSIFWMGPIPMFLTTDPQTLKDILTSKNCLNKPQLIYSGFSIAGGPGLLNEDEPHWSYHRKVLVKAFTPANLSSFVSLFNKEINKSIQQIQKSVEKAEDVDMLSIFELLTIKIATQTTINRDLEKTDINSNAILKSAQRVHKLVATICLNTFFAVSWIRKLAEISVFKKHMLAVKIFYRLITESMDIRETNDTTDPSLLPEINSTLDCALNGALSRSEIKMNSLHVFAGSFETTAATLFFVVTLLAMHPKYQQYAFEELVNILPDDDSDITLEQLNQLTYLEMVLNEVFRLCPIIPMISRKVSNQDLTLSNGLTLPVNQIIAIDIFHLHRRQDIWGPNASDFNPDNFLPANVEARLPYTFIPFSKGQRMCIGWRYALINLKIILAKLIKTYKFTTDFKYEDLLFENRLLLTFTKVPKLHLEQRE